MATIVSSSIFPVNPQELFQDGFDLQAQNIIPQEDFQSTFSYLWSKFNLPNRTSKLFRMDYRWQ